MKNISWGMTPNQRYLTRNNQPFFYLGDTAWELFHRLTLDEAKHYLDVRASQGFNVIQAVCLAEFEGLTQPNQQGDLPLIDLDPTTPNESYFAHVDAVCHYAAEKGLVMALLPSWGDKVNKSWGAGPEVFTPVNARIYGEWLGNRYKDVEPLIWVNGGDRVMATQEHRQVFDAMAMGLHAGDRGAHLITFHPQGGHSSSEDLHLAPWLDFNMIQSGHGERNIDNAAMVRADYSLYPVKPTMESEANYENHAINWKNDTSRFRDTDVRVSSYRSVFAGGCGVTYGCQDVWQFFNPTRNPAIAHADTPWQEALHFSGACQMKHLKNLMEERDFATSVPAQERIVGTANRACVLQGDCYLLAYIPEGDPLTLDLISAGLRGVFVSWYDPRTGSLMSHEPRSCSTAMTFTPPSRGRHNDWVLVITAAE
jgi:hypothetical protein